MKKSHRYSMILHILGIYFMFIAGGYYQEALSRSFYSNQKFTFYMFLNILQNIFGAMVGILILRLRETTLNLSIPLLADYTKCSILKVVSSQLSYKSIEHVTYSMLLILKSCKVLPVLIITYLAYGKVFPVRKYVSAIVLTTGVLIFMFTGHNRSSSTINLVPGVSLIVMSLISEGMMNSIQENIFRKYLVDSYHMMTISNILSALISLCVSVFTREISEGVYFTMRNPEVLKNIVLLCVFNVTGQIFIYSMLQNHGSITLAMVNVTRKLFSVFLSFIAFNNPISRLQILGLGCVALGFFIEISYSSKIKI